MIEYKDATDTRAAYWMGNLDGIFNHFDGIRKVMSGGERVMSNFMNPQAGDGVSECGWSDQRAMTVISRNGSTIKVQRDTAKLLNGMDSNEVDKLQFSRGGFVGHTSGTQRYDYSPNSDAGVGTYSRRKNGNWVRKGESMRGGTKLIAGRHEHYDYNF